MNYPKVPKKYKKIWELATPYFKECRKGDMEHSQIAAEDVYRRGKDKGWDLDVLIPVAIFHDIGHAVILPEHFTKISGPKKEENSKLVHMLTGAKIANDILRKVSWPEEEIKKVIDVISIHDKTDHSLFKTKESRIFQGIDRLDRFTDKTFEVVRKEFDLGIPKTIEILEGQLLPDIINDDFRKEAEKNLKKLKKKYLKK